MPEWEEQAAVACAVQNMVGSRVRIGTQPLPPTSLPPSPLPSITHLSPPFQPTRPHKATYHYQPIALQHLMATALGVAAYWSSPATIHEAEVKEHLGLGEEDKCLGMFHVGSASREVQGNYRAKRGAMSEKVEWRV